jgi:integrase
MDTDDTPTKKRRRKQGRRPRGLGQVFQSKGSPLWRIRWTENGVRRYRNGFTSRELAEQVLATIASNIAHGKAGIEEEREHQPLEKLAAGWLKRRKETHRSAEQDRYRWDKHLKPRVGHLLPEAVDAAVLRRFIEAKLHELSPTTVRLCVTELSALYTDLVERGEAKRNPVRELPRATRRLIRPSHDPRTTPFVEKLGDVRRIYLALEQPINIAYAIGAMAGLRTGEVLGLRWAHVDLAARRIQVREAVTGPLKDDESRVVPILDPLLPLLKAWKLATGAAGLVIPPMRSDGLHCDEHTLRGHLKAALEALKLPAITWYQATRHTFASQWVMAGGSIEKLREMMGHSTVVVTERYSHLKVDLFADRDLGMLGVDLQAPAGEVADVRRTGGAQSEEAKAATS